MKVAQSRARLLIQRKMMENIQMELEWHLSSLLCSSVSFSSVPHLFLGVCIISDISQVALDMTIIATAIPKITDQFKGLDLVGWYGAAFFLTVGAFQSTWGKAYKYFPLKTTFLISIFVFELGSLICGQ
jgi:MFS family permease